MTYLEAMSLLPYQVTMLLLPYLEAMLLLLVLSQSGDRVLMVFWVSRGTLMYTILLA